jgi:menaquinone-dependent protoporphyrinogen oxidase
MSRLLILYGTTNGHTRKIAKVLSETLGEEGFLCDVIDADGVPPELEASAYDGVLVAASIHAGGYQRAVKRWVRAHAGQLNLVPSAFVSVCLGVLERRPEAQAEVREIMHRFLRASGWQPTVTQTVAGALLYTQYGWLTRWFMKRIVAKAGGDTDTSRDYEYTDWDDLRAFARAFARKTMTIGQSIGALP